MMKIRHPDEALLVSDDGSVWLHWEDEDEGLLGLKRGAYWVRGGICWPKYDERGDIRGFAVVAVKSATSGRITVVEQREFLGIDAVFDGPQLRSPGLGTWLNKVSVNWCNRLYFWHQEDDVRKVYARAVMTNDTVQPKPAMREIAFPEENRLTTLRILDQSNRLVWQKDSPVDRALMEYDAKVVDVNVRGVSARDRLRELSPELHALYCAVTGMEKTTRSVRAMGVT